MTLLAFNAVPFLLLIADIPWLLERSFELKLLHEALLASWKCHKPALKNFFTLSVR